MDRLKVPDGKAFPEPLGGFSVCPPRRHKSSRLVAASRNRELAGDCRENGFDLIAEPDQNRDGNDRDESQDQGVLNQCLTFFVPVTLDVRFHNF